MVIRYPPFTVHHPLLVAVFFCGTILTIARTGNYPASLVFRKPGLSSNSTSELATTSPTLSQLFIVQGHQAFEDYICCSSQPVLAQPLDLSLPNDKPTLKLR